MNVIPACIIHIHTYGGCGLIQARSAIGDIYSLIIAGEDFAINHKVLLTFKDNEVVLLPQHFSPYISMLNVFSARVHSCEYNGIFTRACLTMPNVDSHIESASDLILESTESPQKSTSAESSYLETAISAQDTQKQPENISLFVNVLLPALKPLPLSVGEPCMWHIPPSHIILERNV